MPKTVKYIGTVTRWPELATTGKQSAWVPGQQEQRSDTEAAQLLATGLFSDVDATQLPEQKVVAISGVVSEYVIPADEYTDAVTLTATGVVHSMPGRLSSITVVSGSCDLVLADGAGAGTSGIRTIATYAGLTAGELVPFPGDGLPFVNALLATITGTATLRFEVI